MQCPCEPCKLRREHAEKDPSASRRAELYNHPAMDFSDAPPQESDKIELKDYYEFICKYIMTDQVGLISNAHLAAADLEPEGKWTFRGNKNFAEFYSTLRITLLVKGYTASNYKILCKSTLLNKSLIFYRNIFGEMWKTSSKT